MAAQRSVLHVDLDAFFVSVERVLDPSLRARPVVVGGSPERRGVVAAASYEARAHGVRSAMPMARAMQICPDLVRVSGSHRVYRRASKAVSGILGEQVPVIEKVSVDEAYLDLTGTHMVLGKPVDTAEKIRREVRERLQLDLTVGVSRNRLVSKVASAFAKPQGLFEVHAGQEARFLAPLPVKLLPGVGPVTEKRLLEFNIARLGGLATTESWFLESVFGSHGPAMQQRARGEDDTPVCPPWEQPREKSMGHEETFAEDTGEHAFLRAKLQELLASAARRMRQKGM
ncbi:MAG: DNA polymerase IV, partial [Planctomycetes bacterium]|nr:DNA polymerase IV [Planctomycetota bacterium]